MTKKIKRTNSSNNIILIGFMGSGKTSVGTFISNKFSYKFLDTDLLIEKKVNLRIKDIFDCFGENYFRYLEKEVLEELIFNRINGYVISTGGGMPCYRNNYFLLKKLGKIFFLKNSKKVLLKRIKDDTKRPLRFISNLYEKRQHCYLSVADHSISCDTKSIEEVSEEIMLLKNFKELT
jgi:shikimate kinase